MLKIWPRSMIFWLVLKSINLEQKIYICSYIEGLGKELDFHNSGGKLCEVGGRQ